MGDNYVFAVMTMMGHILWTILQDPVLLGIVAFFCTALYLLVVFIRQHCCINDPKTSNVGGSINTGHPYRDGDIDSESSDGMGENPVSIMRISREAHLGFVSGVGKVRMTDNGVVGKDIRGIELGELDLEGSGVCPLTLGICDLECYIERHRQRVGCDLDVWLPHLQGEDYGNRYVSMFDMPGTLPESMSKRERIYRMWMLTVSDKTSARTTVYVPFVPFELGSVTTCDSIAARIAAGDFDAGQYLDLHSRGEWGSIRFVNAVRNEFSAITSHGSIHSRYRAGQGDSEYFVDITTRDDRNGTHISLVDDGYSH